MSAMGGKRTLDGFGQSACSPRVSPDLRSWSPSRLEAQESPSAGTQKWRGINVQSDPIDYPDGSQTMSVIDKAVEANRKYAEAPNPNLRERPAPKVAVVTCMDP